MVYVRSESAAIVTPAPLIHLAEQRHCRPGDQGLGVIQDLRSTLRRAKVQGMDNDSGRSIVNAQVPLAEMLRYTTELRSITGGRGVFTMEESHYEQVPAHIAEGIIASKAKDSDEEED